MQTQPAIAVLLSALLALSGCAKAPSDKALVDPIDPIDTADTGDTANTTQSESEPTTLEVAPDQFNGETQPIPRTPIAPITLDGDFADWDQTNTARADGRYLYIHFSPQGEPPHAIQAAPYTTRLRLNADDNDATGRAMNSMNSMSMEAAIQEPQGVDLLIELSPPNELGSIGIGAQVTDYADSENSKQIGHAGLGFMCLPTFGSTQYEARLDRFAPGATILQTPGTAEITIDQVDAEGAFLWSTTMRVELPELAPELASANTPIASIPIKPAKSVRVMSSNVLYSSPLENPGPFDRVLDAINPDVILYQEWFKTQAPKVDAWLKEYAGPGWTLHMPNDQAGVAIATRHPIIERYDSVIPSLGTGRPARAVAALIDTDAGELLAISIHLKCCGSAGSEEDNKRIAQAQAINSFVREVHQSHPEAKVVIAGDFNLVGSYIPMDTMADSLGMHGEDLSVVHAQQLGNQSMVTWNDEKSRFSPGRLDWMLIDESMSTAHNAFILDTRSLSLDALEELGLEADDSKASDHLPIVMDLTD